MHQFHQLSDEINFEWVGLIADAYVGLVVNPSQTRKQRVVEWLQRKVKMKRRNQKCLHGL